MSVPVPHWQDDDVTLYAGDCIEIMRELPANSVDAIVTDPPYGLGFMGKQWDELPPGLPWAQQCLRVLKPGGHLLAFGGTRTWHRLAVAVEDAGFEIRDSIAWLYGSGFPKSLDVSKAIDRAAGVERALGAPRRDTSGHMRGGRYADGPAGFSTERGTVFTKTAAVTEAAQTWDGWGTALKPAFEPIVVGRKPLAGTVAANFLAHGTGALNIDGCRVSMSEHDRSRIDNMGGFGRAGWSPTSEPSTRVYEGAVDGSLAAVNARAHADGRWPTNVVLDGDQADELDRQSGTTTAGAAGRRGSSGFVDGYDGTYDVPYGDTGGASRFFPVFRYEAKAPTVERPRDGDVAHPTVKPLDLMRWLVRLVTPPGGTVLEPFTGSGTTAEACVLESFRCIAIEREPAYLPLIVQRLNKAMQQSFLNGAA